MVTSCHRGSNAAEDFDSAINKNSLKNTPGCDSGNSVNSKVSCVVAIPLYVCENLLVAYAHPGILEMCNLQTI